MALALMPNRSKYALRIVEVFEFFASGNETATVMDISKGFGRPQSSTSELLQALVDIGLLYRDIPTRTYSPTPRMAALGRIANPEFIRNGRLYSYMDRLAQTTRCPVGLFGAVRTHVQVFHLAKCPDQPARGHNWGSSALLSSSAVGRLLLSASDPASAKGMLWRLNAEAPENERFDLKQAVDDIARIASQGYAMGPSGFSKSCHITAALVPNLEGPNQLAVGVIYTNKDSFDGSALGATLIHGLRQVCDDVCTVSNLVREVS